MVALFESLSKPSVSADAIWGAEKLGIFERKKHIIIFYHVPVQVSKWNCPVTDFYFNK